MSKEWGFCRVCGRGFGLRPWPGSPDSIWRGSLVPNAHLLKGVLCPGAQVPAKPEGERD